MYHFHWCFQHNYTTHIKDFKDVKEIKGFFVFKTCDLQSMTESILNDFFRCKTQIRSNNIQTEIIKKKPGRIHKYAIYPDTLDKIFHTCIYVWNHTYIEIFF